MEPDSLYGPFGCGPTPTPVEIQRPAHASSPALSPKGCTYYSVRSSNTKISSSCLVLTIVTQLACLQETQLPRRGDDILSSLWFQTKNGNVDRHVWVSMFCLFAGRSTALFIVDSNRQPAVLDSNNRRHHRRVAVRRIREPA